MHTHIDRHTDSHNSTLPGHPLHSLHLKQSGTWHFYRMTHWCLQHTSIAIIFTLLESTWHCNIVFIVWHITTPWTQIKPNEAGILTVNNKVYGAGPKTLANVSRYINSKGSRPLVFCFRLRHYYYCGYDLDFWSEQYHSFYQYLCFNYFISYFLLIFLCHSLIFISDLHPLICVSVIHSFCIQLYWCCTVFDRVFTACERTGSVASRVARGVERIRGYVWECYPHGKYARDDLCGKDLRAIDFHCIVVPWEKAIAMRFVVLLSPSRHMGEGLC